MSALITTTRSAAADASDLVLKAVEEAAAEAQVEAIAEAAAAEAIREVLADARAGDDCEG